MNLDDALAHIARHGFGDQVDADAVIHAAAAGLAQIYHQFDLHKISRSSAADQCNALYELLGSVGLPVA